MILIYVNQASPRFLYTLDFVFKERGYEYLIETALESFKQSDLLKLNYSDHNLKADIQIIPSSLLFDEHLQKYTVQKSTFNNIECLSFDGICDIFSSIFYVLSRMEEYYECEHDIHGRFLASKSILYSNGWLEHAICDRWADSIIQLLVEKGLKKSDKNCAFDVEIRPTFDIDNAFAYRHKGFLRGIFSFFRDVKNRDLKRISERFSVIKGKTKDPYDTFDYIQSLATRGFCVHVFWLLGDYATFDKNSSHKNLKHREKIKSLKNYVTLGIHPSYRSNDTNSQLTIEKERLENITGEKVIHSRQHYLKLTFPQTYHNLLNAGITNDYTMGYAEHVGFRSGTARSIQWFDLSANKQTPLKIHPFVYMDGTLNEYLKLDVKDAKQTINLLYNEVQKYGGCFRFIWHNETIGNFGKWKKWNEILEYSLNLK